MLISFTLIVRVKSNDNVTEGRWFSQMIMLPGRPLLSVGLGALAVFGRHPQLRLA